MTNLKTIFKQKSKLLLIVLSLLGMLFSYSCSCRNNSTSPGDGGGDKGQFAPTLSQSKSQLSLYASEDGTSKTNVKIEFTEPNNYDIKNVVLKKVIGKSKDIAAGAEYHFTDKSYSFTISANSLKTVLDDGMDTSQGPATDKLTLTFEITGNKDQVSNVTESVEVTVDLTKAQKIDTTKANSIMNEATKLDTFTSANYSTLFNFNDGGSATGNRTKIPTKEAEDGEPSLKVAASSLKSRNKINYATYFSGYEIIDTSVGVGTKNGTIEIKFSPKIEYDFTESDLTYYIELVLSSSTAFNWKE